MLIHQIPNLRNPVAILAFNGWSDAGEAATGAITHLLSALGNKEFLVAETNSEEYYDYQQIRPMVFIDNSKIRQLKWPNTNVFAVLTPHLDFDLLLIKGPEPSFKWQTFTNELLDLFEDLEVDLVVTLGALLADTPHTRPISVTGTSSNPALASKFGFEVSRYEGPTGILGAIQDGCQRREIDAFSLWAAIPHYAAGSPSPKATLALIEELGDYFNFTFPVGDLPEASKAWEIAVTELAEEDSEISEYVKQLEADKDDIDLEETTGDEIAKEFERFLRRQGDAE
jgi:predicted ATP-grasp superfamily ATP-dependent carboligase